MQFAAFTCKKSPEMLMASPAKNQRPASPLAAPPPPPANESGEVAAAESETYKEYALLCLTNLGDCLILSIPELKRQLNAAAIRREDIKWEFKENLNQIKLNSCQLFSGISSLCFTNHGEALYMMSSSEVQRITLSGKKIVSPNGSIDLEDWDDDEDNEKAYEPKTEEGDENTTVEASTPISAANSDLAINNQKGEFELNHSTVQ